MEKFNAKRLAFVAIIAALYAALTWAIAPLSYGPIQFRISEALKAIVLVQPWAIPGIMIGTFAANLFSPWVGPWELIWMPLTDGIGGLLAWYIGRRYRWIGLALYAITTSSAVALMLRMMIGVPFIIALGTVFVGEIVCIPIGWPIAKRLQSWGFLR